MCALVALKEVAGDRAAEGARIAVWAMSVHLRVGVVMWARSSG